MMHQNVEDECADADARIAEQAYRLRQLFEAYYQGWRRADSGLERCAPVLLTEFEAQAYHCGYSTREKMLCGLIP